MAIQRRRAHTGDLAVWLAVASSMVIGLTFLVSTLGSLLGAPSQQPWFTMMIGGGIAAGVGCALAGVRSAPKARRPGGAGRRAQGALGVG